ncbi:MAG: hypothetical protein WA865_14160 [Spirulinaceae cyanobacterium]
MTELEKSLSFVERNAQAHLQNSKDLIQYATKMAGTGRALVLSSSGCEEVPLDILGRRFIQVDLVEKDAGIVELISRKRSLGNHTYTFYQEDLTCILATITPQAEEIAAVAQNPSSCLQALGQLLISTPLHFCKPTPEPKYNLIVCSGMLTRISALVRQEIESIFLHHFPQSLSALTSDPEWRKPLWQFVRKLEEQFLNHLASLVAHNGMVYLSDTVKVCWLRLDETNQMLTQGAWQTIAKPRLIDYLYSESKVLEQQQWKYLIKKPQGQYWGSLSMIESLVYHFPQKR